jgi:GTP-binding protein HflX
MLVAVGTKSEALMRNSLSELRELADTAGVEVFDEILQRRLPDPKYVLGKGKLEEVILRCLRYSIDIY